MGTMVEDIAMAGYSLLLAVALGLGAPWWLWRMATSGRYREGLGERLGRVSKGLRAMVSGKKTVWVHAVSVGEVLAVERLIAELREALPGWVVALSTTTATGQKIARERLRDCPVFYFPLDFAFAVRAYLRVLRPGLMVLVESEFWPRLLVECERAGVPVAVVNARVSDRSFPRYMRLRRLWKPLLAKVSVFLAQGEESAERLKRIGAKVERVQVSGNLKYDLREITHNAMATSIRFAAAGRPVLLAGSTAGALTANSLSEEEIVIQAWKGKLRGLGVLLVLAPRHPERLDEVEAVASEFRLCRATELAGRAADPALEIVLLNTIGDLASVYGSADVAFVGGSLVAKGGQNPLEAARFGIPMLMGPFYANFREMVDSMRAEKAIRIVAREDLESSLLEALQAGREMGERARAFCEGRAGATARTVAELTRLIDA